MKKFTIFCFFTCFWYANNINAQLNYYIPSHYRGLFYGQPSSTKATGMGLTTITLGGIENAFYNPATIGLTDEKLNVHINYASGSQVYKGNQYPFLGISYRINEKLVVGASTLYWIDEKNSPWTTIIGLFDESVERRSQFFYNLVIAYEIIPNLQFGISGNYLVDRAIDKVVTNSEFILSAGATYDFNVNWIKGKTVQNQKIRFAASLVNALMKNKIEQRYQNYLNFRDLPIHLTFGTSYHLSLPFKRNFTENKRFFQGAPKEVNFSLHIQYREVLKGSQKTVVNYNNEFNSAFGIGGEAWFMNLIALRMGYYFENRPSGNKEDGGYWVTNDKKGFTWGFGVNVPWNRLSNGNIPFNAEINFVTSRLLNEYDKNITVPSYFTDRNFLFSVGVNLKWVK